MKTKFLSAGLGALAASWLMAEPVGDSFVLESKNSAISLRLLDGTWIVDHLGARGPTAAEAARLGYAPEVCYDEIGRVKPWTYSVFGAACWDSADVNKFGGLAVRHADGVTSLELLNVGADVRRTGDRTELTLTLRDSVYPFTVRQHFVAWQDCDAIETWVELVNGEDGDVRLGRMDSLALALPLRDPKASLLTLTGDWAAEGQLSEAAVPRGQSAVIDSRNLTRSAWGANPAFMLSFGDGVTETSGRVLGCALCWTGAFRLGVRHDLADTYELRAGAAVVNGDYVLAPGATLRLPEAVLVWSERGKGEVSRQFHRWARNHRLPHGRELRPVLLNSWEGCYLKVNEPTLLSMMDGLRDLGGELFVVDAGWFGLGEGSSENADEYGKTLGEWVTNAKRLPHGLKWLQGEAAARGLKLGLWVEPEMAGTTSALGEAHPEWLLKEATRPLRLDGQSVRAVLDLPNPAVRDNLFDQLHALYESVPELAYVKWDCNVNLLNPGSPYLAPDRQANLWFDYGAGLRDLLGRLQAAHPQLSVQACASGGAHMDYGFLGYADEFWTSDDTDARERVFIQWGASQFYPAAAMAAHVTASPNHQTGRSSPLKYRFDVAMTGRLGFELHPAELSEEEREFCRLAVRDYKRIRATVQLGDLYRLVSPYERDYAALSYVNDGRTQATVSVLGMLADLHHDYPAPLRLEGLDPAKTYRVTELVRAPGEQPHVRIDGGSFTGAALMAQGFYPLLRHDFDSFTLVLEAE